MNSALVHMYRASPAISSSAALSDAAVPVLPANHRPVISNFRGVWNAPEPAASREWRDHWLGVSRYLAGGSSPEAVAASVSHSEKADSAGAALVKVANSEALPKEGGEFEKVETLHAGGGVQRSKRGVDIFAPPLFDLQLFRDAAVWIHEEISREENQRVEANLLQRVQAIAEARTSGGRRAVIEGALGDLGLAGGRWEYESNREYPVVPNGMTRPLFMRGTNVEADAGPMRDKPILLIGAHFDGGVVDNASGCAAVLELARRFKENPLPDFDVKVGFFDQEEDGMLGSESYVDTCKVEDICPVLYLNLSVFANGTELSVSTTSVSHTLDAEQTAARPDPAAELAFLAALNSTSSPLHVNRTRVTQPSDHLPFQREALAALGISLAMPERGDNLVELRDAVRHYGENPSRVSEKRYKSASLAVLGLDRIESDRPEAVDPAAMRRGIEVIEDAMRRLRADEFN